MTPDFSSLQKLGDETSSHPLNLPAQSCVCLYNQQEHKVHCASVRLLYFDSSKLISVENELVYCTYYKEPIFSGLVLSVTIRRNCYKIGKSCVSLYRYDTVLLFLLQISVHGLSHVVQCKEPVFPTWAVCSESHCTVLFNHQRKLLHNW